MEKLKYSSFDHEEFDYLLWQNSPHPKTIIIAIHGINGAACDYSNLATHLTEKITPDHGIAIYATETRGQGNDPQKSRRGDIYKKQEWFKDLYTVTKMVNSLHPKAEIIWCGESMGSLIVTHAHAQIPPNNIKPSKIILLAPVVSLRPHLPFWKHKIANTLAYILPRFKVSLNQFSGQNAVKVTQGTDNHHDQAATNSYFIEKFTLRLLATLGNLITKMNASAKHLNTPTMVINGGKDYFTPPEYAEEFFKHIPKSPKNHHSYHPDSYHLLMYDQHREKIFNKISSWITQ